MEVYIDLDMLLIDCFFGYCGKKLCDLTDCIYFGQAFEKKAMPLVLALRIPYNFMRILTTAQYNVVSQRVGIRPAIA